MTRSMVGLATVIALVLGTAAPSTHEKFRIIGTIAKVHRAQLDVKAVDGQLYEIDLDSKTRVTLDKKKAAASELKAGRAVIVDALGHDMFDLVAVEVQVARGVAPKR